VSTPNLRPAGSGELYGVSCPATQHCVAAGLTANGTFGRARPLAGQGRG